MKVIQTKVAHRESHLLLNETEYQDNLGKTRKWFWAERPHNTSAVMIAAMHGDNLVVIKEFRVPLNAYIYALPAGLVENNEYPLNAAIRELKEETGLTIDNHIRDFSPMTFTSPGMTDERLTIVFANVSGVTSIKNQESSESIETLFLTQEEARDIIQRGEKIDSKAYLIMLRFAEDGKI